MRPVALAGCLLALHAPHVAAEPVIAVLEHPQCVNAAPRAVRPLFARTTNGWAPLLHPSSLSSAFIDWQAVDGAATQHVETIAPVSPALLPSWSYPRDFLLQVKDQATLPSSPNDGESFAGWCEPPKNRPILLVAGFDASSPKLIALRRPSQRPPLARLLKALRASYGSTKLCVSDNPQPVRLGVADLVVSQFVETPGGTALVALTLRRDLTECGSELGGTELPRWFALDQGTHFVGSSLTLVGAADFDADGAMEYMFWYSGYNEDGYVLFSGNFERPIRFTWKYH